MPGGIKSLYGNRKVPGKSFQINYCKSHGMSRASDSECSFIKCRCFTPILLDGAGAAAMQCGVKRSYVQK